MGDLGHRVQNFALRVQGYQPKSGESNGKPDGQ